MLQATAPQKPLVTIIIPCLNEARFIEDCLVSIIESGYPTERLEILVLDGMSGDGTRKILERMRTRFEFIQVVDNPGASKPKALNEGIRRAKGGILMRVDAHAVYHEGYVPLLVEALLANEMAGVVNVGGVRINQPRDAGVLSRCFAELLGHRFGVGDAHYNTGVDAPRLTNIVFLFCARPALFAELGGFDPRLRRGQDREFNLRVAQRHSMMIVPSARCTYFTRSTIREFLPWAIECGDVPFRISNIAGRNLTSWRNFAPLGFFAGLGLLSLLAAVHPAFLYLLAFAGGAYSAVALASGAWVGWKQKSIAVALTMPFVFTLWHACYAIGSARGILSRSRT